MKKKLYYLIPIALIVSFLDRLTKLFVSERMRLFESKSIIGNFFRITYVRNPYAAFSMKFGNYYVMMVLSFIAVFFIAYYFAITKFTKLKIIALSMILGGAIGNIYDRLMQREVVDFLDFGIGKWRYATFNIADSFVVIGSILLFIYLFNEKEHI